MKTNKELKKKILIMIVPILLPSILFLIVLGESFFLFAFPLAIFLFISIKLAKSLSMKDAIAYPFVQYPFFILVFVLSTMFPPGLEFILTFPVTFIINIIIGIAYFKFANKKDYTLSLLLF
ncbi:MAG: hypothetical protein FWC95_07150 [Defluviitaleaceae bacterium]|nr:hypothetical protein [Defluviitaleaceae bacterium]